ncbi:MAG TPA: DeoR/GlpR transcriptional regulator [Candidatus Merdisoma merdipullorum]|nr:DeoR/GlpR transcriptional regulator [Candidatus Merdisoma merdipullorum]
MLKEQRCAIILSTLEQKTSVTIDELVALTQSSRATIHRDIETLASRHVLQKVRGGVIRPEAAPESAAAAPVYEPPFLVRHDMYLEEKQRIAAAAHQYVKSNETLFLGGGTTVYEFAKTLHDIKPLYIATNDLQSAFTLAGFSNVDLNVLGGSLRQSHYSLNGYFTEQMISQMHADTAFIGIDAVDLSIGYMNFSTSEIRTNKLMIERSHKTIILCDHSKFESVAFVNICKLTDVDLLITGKELKDSYAEQLEQLGVNFLQV